MAEKKEKEAQKSFKEKLLAVAGAVKCVEKDGTNAFHKYKYATAANVMEAVKEACQAHRLIISASVLDAQETRERSTKNGSEWLTRATIRFTISDVDSDAKLESDFVGFGTDSGDKGIYKAYTGACKYFLFQNFQIATDDDPENERKQPEPKQQPQAKPFQGNPFSAVVRLSNPEAKSSVNGKLLAEIFQESPEKLQAIHQQFLTALTPESRSAVEAAMRAIKQGTAQQLSLEAFAREHGYEPENGVHP